MKKIKNAVVLTLSKNLTFSAGTLILNLEDIMKDVIEEYVVIHDGIREKDKLILSSLAKVRFIKYEKPEYFFKKIDPLIMNQFTKLVFAKFECLRLLEEYENIIMTDTDVVFYKNIEELLIKNNSGLKFLFGSSLVRSQFKESIDGYDMTLKGMGAGLIVFHDNLKAYNKLYDFCYGVLTEYGDKIKMPEQAVFDLMIQNYKLFPCELDAKVYCRLPKDQYADQNYKILHSAGQPKFWSGLDNEIWQKYYIEWIRLGGSHFDKKKYWINIIAPVSSRRRKLVQATYHKLLGFGK